MKVIIELERAEINDEMLNCLKAMSNLTTKKQEKKAKNEMPIEFKQEKTKEEKVEDKEKHKCTFDEAKSAAIRLKESKGKEMAKQILNLFNATKLGEIKEEDYGDFIRAVEEVL